MKVERAPQHEPRINTRKTKKAVEKTAETIERERNESAFKVGDTVKFYTGYKADQSKEGEITEISPEGMYTIKSEGVEYWLTQELLEADVLKHNLRDGALDAIGIAASVKKIPENEKADMVKYIDLLIDELVIGSDQQTTLQAQINNIVLSMSRLDKSKRIDIVMNAIANHSNVRTDKLARELIALNYEDGDINKFVADIATGVGDITSGDNTHEPEELIYTATEVIEQLQVESTDAAPDQQPRIASALDLLRPTLNLALHVVSEHEYNFEFISDIVNGIHIKELRAEKIRAKYDMFQKMMLEQIKAIQNAPHIPTLEAAPSTPTAKTKETPTDTNIEQKEINSDPRESKLYNALVDMYLKIGTPDERRSEAQINDMIDKWIDSSDKTTRNAARAFDDDIVSGKIKLSAPKVTAKEATKTNIDTPESVADNALQEKTAVDTQPVKEAVVEAQPATEDTTEAESSHEEARNPRESKLYKSLVRLYKNIGTSKETKTEDEIFTMLDKWKKHPEERIQKIVDAFEDDLAVDIIKRVDHTEAVSTEKQPSTGDQAETPATPKTISAHVENGLSEPQKAEKTSDNAERIRNIIEFLKSDNGKLVLLADSSLSQLLDLDVETYNKILEQSKNGGFFVRRNARKFINRYNSLIAKAENQMVDKVAKAGTANETMRDIPSPTLRTQNRTRKRGSRGGAKKSPYNNAA